MLATNGGFRSDGQIFTAPLPRSAASPTKHASVVDDMFFALPPALLLICPKAVMREDLLPCAAAAAAPRRRPGSTAAKRLRGDSVKPQLKR